MSGQLFRVRKRRHDAQRLRSTTTSGYSNLFARLPKACAERLRDQALLCQSEERCNDAAAESANFWMLSTSLDFLPLCIEIPEYRETIHVSYNGGEVVEASSLNQAETPIIELPECLFSRDALACQQVLVKALWCVENAETVHLEPLTVRDWDLLQEHAQQLEAGHLLEQISIVYPNQIVPLQVGSTSASVRVLPTNFSHSNSSFLWPQVVQHPCDRCCLRLVANTELIVSPVKAPDETLDPVLRLMPCLEDYNEAVQQFAQDVLRRRRTKVPNSSGVIQLPLPYTVAVHPRTLSTFQSAVVDPRFCSLQLVTSTGQHTQSVVTAVARIVTNDDVPEDCAVLHPLVRLKLRGRLFLDQVSFRVLNHVETDRMARRFYDFVEESLGRNRTLSLVPITLNRPTQSSWRMVDVANCHRTEGLSPTPTFDIPNDAGDLPVEIGGLVQFPWIGGSRKRLFRVVLSETSEQDASEDNPPVMLFFARDFDKYVGYSNGVNFSPDRENYEVLALSPMPYAMDCLPAGSIIRDPVLEYAERMLVRPGALIYGPRGSGRSHTAFVLATSAALLQGSSTVYMNCKRLRDSRKVGMKEIISELTQLFQDAVQITPCSVILDSVDELVPANDAGSPTDDIAKSQQINPAAVEQSKLLGDALCHLVEVARSQSRLHVIATCEAPESISESVIASALLGSSFMVPTLSSSEREALLLNFVHRRNREYRFDCDVGKLTEGFRPRDIEQVALRICERVRRIENSSTVFDDIVTEVLGVFVPLGRASAAVEHPDSGPTWSHVGGLYRAKEQLASIIIKPSLYRRIYESSQVRLPRGVLLFGESGNGKTYVVSALAKECGYRLITCRGAELLDKYIGASEANVRELFTRATAVAPSILFLDELDALAPRRGSDHTGVTDRIVNQLLTFLDGVEDVSHNEKVYVIAASSRPDKVDPALLRPGRLEKHIYVGFSETRDEVSDLLSKVALNYEIDDDTLDQIRSGHFVNRLFAQYCFSSRMSAADIKGAFNTAQVIAVHEALREDRTDNVVINSARLLEAFCGSQPSLSSDEYNRLQSVYAPYRGEEFPAANSDPADMASGSARLTGNVEREPLRTALR